MTEHLIPDPLKVGRKVLASTHRTALQTGIYMGARLDRRHDCRALRRQSRPGH